jgi:hypothetical protein
MKKFIFLALICLLSLNAVAQGYNNDYMTADSAAVVSPVDSSLVGVSVFDLLKRNSSFGSGRSIETGGNGEAVAGGVVVLHQDASVKAAFESYVKSNPDRAKTGYRIIVFSSNAQSARGESESIASQFKDSYPGLGIYRSYANPFFKVTVGDYRTKTDALKLYYEISGRFPRAKIIKDRINWCQF